MNELIKKIILKKEFSQLPKKDVFLAFKKFDKEKYDDEEKIKLTRNLLRLVYSSFISKKILSLKEKSEDWILRKHLSTKERLPYYEEVYKKILRNMNKKLSVLDLGAGINGFSYKYFQKAGFDISYYAVEAVGQFVELMNFYFKKEKLNAKAFHLSLFEINKIKRIVLNLERPRVVLLFKVIDSLEALEKDYSKKLISEIARLSDRLIISFATKSMSKRKKFRVKRNWIVNFVKENFNLIDDFELGGERYIVFSK
jgi:hypothetical protein